MVARNITLDLPEVIDKGLQRLAESTGRSTDEVIREAVERYVATVERQPRPLPKPEPGQSVLDALKRAGLVGCEEGLPPDLSTNPKYMEGFGE